MTKTRPQPKREGYLDGQVLVAMPGMTDDRFMRSVIYICAHSQDGAMGIVVNHPAQSVTFSEILLQLEVVGSASEVQWPIENVPVVRGGPVEASRGFVLHTPDYYVDHSTLTIDDGVSLTATLDILRAIADGKGPAKAVLALGYAGWSAGQLETEIQANGWLNCAADNDLLFDSALDGKYGWALRKIGIDPAQLSTQLSAQAGHA